MEKSSVINYVFTVFRIDARKMEKFSQKNDGNNS